MSKKVKNRKYQYCAFPMSTANLHVSPCSHHNNRHDAICPATGTRMCVLKHYSKMQHGSPVETSNVRRASQPCCRNSSGTLSNNAAHKAESKCNLPLPLSSALDFRPLRPFGCSLVCHHKKSSGSNVIQQEDCQAIWLRFLKFSRVLMMLNLLTSSLCQVLDSEVMNLSYISLRLI